MKTPHITITLLNSKNNNNNYNLYTKDDYDYKTSIKTND